MKIICSDRNCTFWVVFLTVSKTRNNAYICDLYTTLQHKICIIYENTKKIVDLEFDENHQNLDFRNNIITR